MWLAWELAAVSPSWEVFLEKVVQVLMRIPQLQLEFE
jgi:hypothetical protein